MNNPTGDLALSLETADNSISHGERSATPPSEMSVSSLKNREQRTSLIALVKSLANAPAPVAAENLREIIAFENKLYPIIQADKRWFFSRANKIEAIQFSRDMFVLHSVAAQTLATLIDRRAEWSYTNSDQLLQQMVAFALYHYCAAIKWSFFRHEPIKPTVWPELHKLFQFAEKNGFATSAVILFDDAPTTSAVARPDYISAQSLYIRALLLDVLNTGSLTTEQVEIADGWLAEWASKYSFENTYLPNAHSLFVDLQMPAGLQLITGSSAGNHHRYLRQDALKNQVEAVRNELRAGRTYQGRGAPYAFTMEQHVALLSTIERLYQTLLNASASRIEERTEVANLSAEICLDFESVRRAIAGEAPPLPAESSDAMKFGAIELSLAPVLNSEARAAEFIEESIDESKGEPDGQSNDESNATKAQRQAHQRLRPRWKIYDISSKGVGLLVERAAGEEVSLNQIIAIKPDSFAYWMVGVVVRKIMQPTTGQTLLGVQILCYRPLPVSLTRTVAATDSRAETEAAVATLAATVTIAALYLPDINQDGKSDILILPASDFQLKNVFSLVAETSQFSVRINRVLRQGRDWVGLRFEVIGKA